MFVDVVAIPSAPTTGKFGLTLAETIVALALGTLLSLGLLSLIGVIVRGSQFNMTRVRAVHLSQAEMSRWKLSGYSNLAGFLSSPPGPLVIQDAGQTFTESVSVQRLSSNSSNPDYHVLQVTVRLDWVERKSLNSNVGESDNNTETSGSTELVSLVAGGTQF